MVRLTLVNDLSRHIGLLQPFPPDLSRRARPTRRGGFTVAALPLSHSHPPVDRRAGIPLSTFVIRLIWLCILPLLLLAVWLAVDSARTTLSDRDLEAANLTKNFANAIDHDLNARIAALNVLAVSLLVDYQGL